MDRVEIASRRTITERHRTTYLEAGPPDGPLVIFVHGWPELGIVWRAQLEYFGARGWRCIAPDMRGYGGSSTYDTMGAFAVRELVADMLELHDALGGAPAVWVGHDWGSPVAWSIASHHATRCRAVANLCVPYQARGFALANLLPLVDRERYPVDTHSAGQWDYFLFYREHFARAARDFEADVSATLALLYRRTLPESAGKRTALAEIRRRGGWFGGSGRARSVPRDASMLSQSDFDALVDAFSATGFSGPDAWYMNDDANVAYAAEAPNFGRIASPALFLHAAWDAVCDTTQSRLAEPMREDCADLTEIVIEGGHELMLECPSEVNAALDAWLAEVTSRSAAPDRDR